MVLVLLFLDFLGGGFVGRGGSSGGLSIDGGTHEYISRDWVMRVVVRIYILVTVGCPGDAKGEGC